MVSFLTSLPRCLLKCHFSVQLDSSIWNSACFSELLWNVELLFIWDLIMSSQSQCERKKNCCVCDFWIRKLLALKNEEHILAFWQTPNSTELLTLNHFESNLLSLDLISFLNDVVCQKKKKMHVYFWRMKVNVIFFC